MYQVNLHLIRTYTTLLYIMSILHVPQAIYHSKYLSKIRYVTNQNTPDLISRIYKHNTCKLL